MPKTYPGERNPNWKGGISKKEFICVQCKNLFTGHHSRNAKFCSINCKAEYQKTMVGEKSAKWLGGERIKLCEGCGSEIKCTQKKAYSVFLKQKFCSKRCADKNGFRYSDISHWRFNPNKEGRDKVLQKVWSKSVLERDNFVCQDCGKKGGDLHAHHKEAYAVNEALRWEIDNGITLCKQCHYKTYKTGNNEKRVNSGKVQNG